MKKYMLDTNMVSYALRQYPIVLEKLKQLPVSALFISSITEGELRFGLARKPAAKVLHDMVSEFIKYIEVLPWNSDTAKVYGTIRANLTSIGKVISPLDMLIAAHAISINAVLVTSDCGFNSIDELKTENWLLTAH